MKSFELKPGKTALVIVAHPDDEIIFMGGVISKNPRVSWTIFSLCRASDQDRMPKFFRVCQKHNARGIIADLEDEGKLSADETLPLIKEAILAKIKNKKYNYIFTHGANGEYGHPRHIGVHQVVKQLINNKILKPETVFYFNYKKINPKQFSPLTSKTDSNCLIKLSKAELQAKREIVAYMYGYDITGIDVGYCTNPEAFLEKKL